jgi:hypothetical protein
VWKGESYAKWPAVQLGKRGNERGESLEARCVGGLLVVYVCVSLLSLIDAKRQFLYSRGADERVAQTHRKIHASTFMVALSLTGKQSGGEFVTGLSSFFAQLPSQNEMVGRSQPWICTMRPVETANLLCNQVARGPCDGGGKVARTQDFSVRALGEGERCGPKDGTALGLKAKIGDRVSCTESTQMQTSLTRLQLSYKTLVWSGKGLDSPWFTSVSVVWARMVVPTLTNVIYFELAAPIWGLLTRSR